jgi:hypothetical protein
MNRLTDLNKVRLLKSMADLEGGRPPLFNKKFQNDNSKTLNLHPKWLKYFDFHMWSPLFRYSWFATIDCRSMPYTPRKNIWHNSTLKGTYFQRTSSQPISASIVYMSKKMTVIALLLYRHHISKKASPQLNMMLQSPIVCTSVNGNEVTRQSFKSFE